MENEPTKKLANLLNERVDLKAITISALDGVLKVINSGKIEQIKVPHKLELVILTNFGYITGDYVDDLGNNDDPELIFNDFNKFMFTHMFEQRNSLVERFEAEGGLRRLTNDGGVVYLRNVEVKPFSNPQNSIHFGDLCLFPDQIVGVTAKNNID